MLSRRDILYRVAITVAVAILSFTVIGPWLWPYIPNDWFWLR